MLPRWSVNMDRKDIQRQRINTAAATTIPCEGLKMGSTNLAARLAERKAAYTDPESAAVTEIVMSVLSTMSGDMGPREAALLHEINTLGMAVATAREEIAALHVDDIMISHIPCATDELDAIVAHTAAATESILEVCETLDMLGAGLEGEAGADLQMATGRIYEACSFQDITGQRITKVVATLKTIESTIARISSTFGQPQSTVEVELSSKPEGVSLLNGPQLPGAAMDQADIDRLLASFD